MLTAGVTLLHSNRIRRGRGFHSLNLPGTWVRYYYCGTFFCLNMDNKTQQTVTQ